MNKEQTINHLKDLKKSLKEFECIKSNNEDLEALDNAINMLTSGIGDIREIIKMTFEHIPIYIHDKDRIRLEKLSELIIYILKSECLTYDEAKELIDNRMVRED